MDECERCGGSGWAWNCRAGYGDDGYCYGVEEQEVCFDCEGTGIEGAKCECLYANYGRNVDSTYCTIHGMDDEIS